MLQIGLGDLISPPINVFTFLYPTVASVSPTKYYDVCSGRYCSPEDTERARNEAGKVEIHGTNFGCGTTGASPECPSVQNEVAVLVGGAPCEVKFHNATKIECFLEPGTTPVVEFDPRRDLYRMWDDMSEAGLDGGPVPSGLVPPLGDFSHALSDGIAALVEVRLGTTGLFGALAAFSPVSAAPHACLQGGRYRSSNSSYACEKCPPGTMGSGAQWPFSCEECSDMEYSDKPGSRKCTKCPIMGTSALTAKSSREACYCLPGHYTRSKVNGTACRVCERGLNNPGECPMDMLLTGNIIESCLATICKGGDHWPVAKPGAFIAYTGDQSNGDEFPVAYWCPQQEACLGENVCVEGHKGLMCRECKLRHYQRREGSVKRRKRTPGSRRAKSGVTMSLCYPCDEDSIRWVAVGVGLWALGVLLLTFLMLQVINFELDEEAETERYQRIRHRLYLLFCGCCHACGQAVFHRNAKAAAAVAEPMHEPEPEGEGEGENKTKKKKKPNFLKVKLAMLFAALDPTFLVDVCDNIEWDQLLQQLINTSHHLMGIALVGIEWPSIVYEILEIVNIIMFRFDKYPIGCVISVSYFTEWAVLTSAPYVIAGGLFFVYCLKVASVHFYHKDRDRAKLEAKIIPIPVMQVLIFVMFAWIMVHVEKILIPYGCVPCGPVGQMCLARSTGIICGSGEHQMMKWISRTLLFFLMLYMAAMMGLMYYAFLWQKNRPDETMPWYLAGIGDLVCYMKGYNGDAGWPEPTFSKMFAAMQGEHYVESTSMVDFARRVTRPVNYLEDAGNEPPEAQARAGGETAGDPAPANPPVAAAGGAAAAAASRGASGASSKVNRAESNEPPAQANPSGSPEGATSGTRESGPKENAEAQGKSSAPRADDESSLGSLDNEALRSMGIDVHVADDQVSLGSNDHRNLQQLGVKISYGNSKQNVEFKEEVKGEEDEEEEEEEEEEEDVTESFLAFSYMIWGVFICCDLPLQYFATIFGDQAELALFSQALVFGLQSVLVAFFKPFEPDGVNLFCVVATFFVFLMAISTAFTELFRKYTFTEAGKAYSHLVEPLDYVSSMWMLGLIGWYVLLVGGKLFVEVYLYITNQDIDHSGDDAEDAKAEDANKVSAV
jgi:hypothetical protein